MASIKLFSVSQKKKDESTLIYLRRFNAEMFKVKELIEIIALKTLIKGVKEQEYLYFTK